MAPQTVHRCSFCGRSQHEAEVLVGSDDPLDPVFICEACVAKAKDIAEARKGAP